MALRFHTNGTRRRLMSPSRFDRLHQSEGELLGSAMCGCDVMGNLKWTQQTRFMGLSTALSPERRYSSAYGKPPRRSDQGVYTIRPSRVDDRSRWLTACAAISRRESRGTA
jgi:hypothetical protein